MTNTEGSTGIIFICGKSTKGRVETVHELLGDNIIGVAEGLSVLTTKGIFSVLKRKYDTPFENNIAIGYGKCSNASICVMKDGSLYSWGEAELGELGLGTKIKKTNIPIQITYNAEFACIASGEVHSCALDRRGNAYSWGQNRSRQLGLYNRTKEQMKNPNIFIEDFIFMPRFIPFSLKHPIRKICCGSRFTLALSKEGDVWAWGAGECGQQGDGDAAMREVPACVVFDQHLSTTEKLPYHFEDIAAGYGHCLAVTDQGVLFAWGLNAKHQLGLDDNHNHYNKFGIPQKLPFCETHASKVMKVYAKSHSSACIDENGQLFTWGSNAYNKLHQHLPPNVQTTNIIHQSSFNRVLQENAVDFYASPALVEAFIHSRVHDFAFYIDDAVAYVVSSLTEISPRSGPIKSFSRLQLLGYGFWPSQDCVVRFKLLGGSRYLAGKIVPNPMRSCLGTVVDETQVQCIPPKFATAGEYEVSLSLNGRDFLSNTCTVSIYHDPVVQSVEPKLLDLNETTRAEVTMILKKMPDLTGPLFVKYSAFSMRGTSTSHVLAEVTQQIENSSLQPSVSSPIVTLSNAMENLSLEKNADNSMKLLTSSIDFAMLPRGKDGFILKTCVSLNRQDFSKYANDVIICHQCSPSQISPNCISALSGDGGIELLVVGQGFPHSSWVPTSIQIYLDSTDSGGISSSSPKMEIFPVVEKSTEFRFKAPALDELLSVFGERLREATSFNLVLYTFIAGKAVNSEHPFYVMVYNPGPLTSSSTLCRRTGGSVITLHSSCLSFFTDAAKIRITLPGNDTYDYLIKAPLTALDEDGSSSGGGAYEIQVTLPSLCPEPVGSLETGEGSAPGSADDTVELALLLDGTTTPPAQYSIQLRIFDGVQNITLKNPPKAGTTTGAAVSCLAKGILPTTNCVVRIIGAAETFIETQATVNAEESSFSFTVPDLTTVPPAEMKGKLKGYFIAVSLDSGSTFDHSEAAVLYMK